MENISTKKIAVQVFGNPDSNAGFTPLVNLNGLMPPLNDVTYPGVSLNPYFFVIRTDVNYTQYMLVHNRAKSNLSSRGGALKIAIGIPTGTIIQGHVSPYNLLMKIFEIFSEACMEKQPSGDLMYKPFPQTIKEGINNRISEILNSFPLVDRTNPHRPMTTSGQRGLLLIPSEKNEQLFQDVQYPEFVPFSEIVVAQQADTTQYSGRVITGLPIPRRNNFRIFVNGKASTKILSSENVTISAYIDGGFDRNCYNDELLTLSPNEILSDNDRDGVKVNFVEERIDITMNPKKKIAKLTIKIDGCSSFANISFRIGNLSVPISGPIVVAPFEGERIKMLLQNQYAAVSYNGQAYQPTNSNPQIIKKTETEFEVNISFRQINIQQQNNGSNLPAKTSNDPTLIITLKNFNPKDYDIKEYENAITKKNERGYIRLFITYGDKQNEGYKKYIINAKVEKKDRIEQLTVKIPSELSNKTCTVSMPDWKLKKQGVKILEPKTELRWMDFPKYEEEKKFKLPPWVLIVIFTLLAFCVGLCAGKFLLNGTPKTGTSQTNDTTNIIKEPEQKPYDPQKSYNYYQDEFDKEELTFATVQQCQRWINDTILKGNLQGKLQDFNQFKEMVDAYNDVVNTILTIDGTQALINVLQKYRNTDLTFTKLNQQHVDLARKAYNGNNTEQKTVRKGIYNANHKTFKSFQDFNICEPKTTRPSTPKEQKKPITQNDDKLKVPPTPPTT